MAILAGIKFGSKPGIHKYWRNFILRLAQPNLQESAGVKYWWKLIWRFKPRPPNSIFQTTKFNSSPIFPLIQYVNLILCFSDLEGQFFFTKAKRKILNIYFDAWPGHAISLFKQKHCDNNILKFLFPFPLGLHKDWSHSRNTKRIAMDQVLVFSIMNQEVKIRLNDKLYLCYHNTAPQGLCRTNRYRANIMIKKNNKKGKWKAEITIIKRTIVSLWNIIPANITQKQKRSNRMYFSIVVSMGLHTLHNSWQTLTNLYHTSVTCNELSLKTMTCKMLLDAITGHHITRHGYNHGNNTLHINLEYNPFAYNIPYTYACLF